MHDVHLSVNVDHVATVRQARGIGYPDPVEAARLAEGAGAAGITVHLRGDRRHIQEADVTALREAVRGKLNVEMATTDEMLAIAERHRPHQVTLVPERPEELTTEGGLDLESQGQRVAESARRLREAGIAVSVFLDPDLAQVARLAEIGAEIVAGFEINTDAYTRSSPGEVSSHLEGMRKVAERGHDLGFRVYAGHGLTTGNAGAVARIPWMEELNIGHFLVARSMMVGMPQAVREMLKAMQAEG